MKNVILSFISFSFLYFIFNFYNIDATQFNIFKFETFIIIIAFTIISIILNSVRLYLISFNILKIKFRDYLFISFGSFVFNVLSFSGTGELIKYYLLSYRLKKKTDILSFFLLEKGYGLISIFILISFSISWFFFGIIYSLLILSLIFLILFLVSSNNFFLHKIPYLNYFNFSFYSIYSDVNKSRLLATSLLIHITYIIQLFIIIYFIYKVNININNLIFLTLTILILNSIPITYSGFGAREFSVVIMGFFINLEETKLINSIIALGIYTYLFALIISIYLYLALKVNYKIDLLRTFLSKKITHVRIK